MDGDVCFNSFTVWRHTTFADGVLQDQSAQNGQSDFPSCQIPDSGPYRNESIIVKGNYVRMGDCYIFNQTLYQTTKR